MLTIDAVYIINLARRPDRMDAFYKQSGQALMGWKIPTERVEAVDGMTETPPAWWPASRGAYGCYHSHMNTLLMAYNQKKGNILILEDDAEFCPDFNSLFKVFASEVPDNWGLVYLGGEHKGPHTAQLSESIEAPVKVSVPSNVRCTHAYCVHKDQIPYLYQHLQLNCTAEVDEVLWDWADAGFVNIYCPDPWLVKQSGSSSDIPKVQKQSSVV